MSFEKERAEAVALVEEALEEFDIDATRAEINSFVDAYTADTINDLELADDDYTQDALIEEYDLPDDEFEGNN